jgi:hypothetical protein
LPGSRAAEADVPLLGAPATVPVGPESPKKLFEVKKPEKKPAQPQTDQYFDF